MAILERAPGRELVRTGAKHHLVRSESVLTLTHCIAALLAAANDNSIKAVVSRGGRPDLAGKNKATFEFSCVTSYTGHLLSKVVAPTLLIVGGNDDVVIGLNQIALSSLGSKGADDELNNS